MQSSTGTIITRRGLTRLLAALMVVGIGAASVVPSAHARDRDRLGSYRADWGKTGAWQRRAQREHRRFRSAATWENRRGSGDRPFANARFRERHGQGMYRADRGRMGAWLQGRREHGRSSRVATRGNAPGSGNRPLAYGWERKRQGQGMNRADGNRTGAWRQGRRDRGGSNRVATRENAPGSGNRPQVYAWDRERQGSYQTDRGKTGTWQRQAQREPGSSSRATTWENDRGSGDRSVDRRWDRDAGTAETERSVTRADGKSAQSSRSSTRNPDGSVTQQGSGTDFQGRSVTMDRRMEATEDGSVQALTTRTRDDGKSVATEQTIQRTDEGITRSGTYVTGDGRSGTMEGATARTETGVTTDRTYTSAEGKTLDRSISYERTDDGLERTVTTTGPGGQSRDRTLTVTPE